MEQHFFKKRKGISYVFKVIFLSILNEITSSNIEAKLRINMNTSQLKNKWHIEPFNTLTVVKAYIKYKSCASC